MRKYIIFLMLIVNLNVNGQLNEFMVTCYSFVVMPPNETISDFYLDLKVRNFNTILVYAAGEESKGINKFNYLYEEISKNSLDIIPCKYELSLSVNAYDSGSAWDIMKNDSVYTIKGYQVMDEPEFENLSDIPRFTNLIHSFDSTLIRFVNLLPTSGSIFQSDQQYREDYIQQHVLSANPNLLSFDDYPLFWPIFNFYRSLYDISIKSNENSIPFIYVLTPFRTRKSFYEEDSNMQAKTIEEFNYVIYAALCYGAKGIAYWPGFRWVQTRKGSKYLNYGMDVEDYLGNLHGKLIKNSEELLLLNFTSAYHKTNNSTIKIGEVEEIHPFCLWSNFINDKYAKQVFTDMRIPLYETSTNDIPDEIAVTFLTNKSGQVYFWLFNKSLSRSLKLKLNLKNTCRDVLNEAAVSNENIINLSPGEAKLFTPITQSPLIYTQIADQVYDNEFYPLETAHIFNLGFSSSDANSITFNSGATKSFVANTISIKSMHAKPGSIVRFKSYEDSNKIPPFVLPERNIKLSAKHGSTEISIASLEDEAYVYPNPALENHVYLHMELEEKDEAEIKLYDATGNLVMALTTTTKETLIPINKIQNGIFFLHVIKNCQVYNLKVIKR